MFDSVTGAPGFVSVRLSKNHCTLLVNPHVQRSSKKESSGMVALIALLQQPKTNMLRQSYKLIMITIEVLNYSDSNTDY